LGIIEAVGRIAGFAAVTAMRVQAITCGLTSRSFIGFLVLAMLIMYIEYIAKRNRSSDFSKYFSVRQYQPLAISTGNAVSSSVHE
jgi:nitrate/nitrite transporter NarK